MDQHEGMRAACRYLADKERDRGLGFFRGLIVALVISAGMWVLIIWALRWGLS